MLKTYNNQINPESTVKNTRIGIQLGHVFFVNSLNNNRNLWGPAIIIIKRVIDKGDEGHILLEGELTNTLFIFLAINIKK